MTQKRLWAPWRQEYLKAVRRPKSRGCLFCQKGRSKLDARNHVIARGEYGFSLLNRFPYNNGHLMVVPYRHVGQLSGLKKAEWVELHDLANDAIARMDQVLSPQGYNLGINLGREAGAGIPGHLHLHIVPRWRGDTNFMPVVAGTKVISQSLESAYRLLAGKSPSQRRRKRR